MQAIGCPGGTSQAIGCPGITVQAIGCNILLVIYPSHQVSRGTGRNMSLVLDTILVDKLVVHYSLLRVQCF